MSANFILVHSLNTSLKLTSMIRKNENNQSTVYCNNTRRLWYCVKVFSGVRVTRSLVLCVCFVDRCLSFFFWPLCCLFFFDSDYHLDSSNSYIFPLSTLYIPIDNFLLIGIHHIALKTTKGGQMYQNIFGQDPLPLQYGGECTI